MMKRTLLSLATVASLVACAGCSLSGASGILGGFSNVTDAIVNLGVIAGAVWLATQVDFTNLLNF